MKETRGLIVGAAALIAVLLALRALLGQDPSQRSWAVFPDMVHTPAKKSFGQSRFLPGGMVQQPLVAGVVTQEAEDFPYGLGPEEQARAGRELRNPIKPDDPAALARGAKVYGIYCTPCHGQDGEGRGLAVVRGMLPPPAYKAARAMSLTDGELYHILTLGQNNMAAYAAQIAPQDRWQVILHLRTLQKETR